MVIPPTRWTFSSPPPVFKKDTRQNLSDEKVEPLPSIVNTDGTWWVPRTTQKLAQLPSDLALEHFPRVSQLCGDAVTAVAADGHARSPLKITFLAACSTFHSGKVPCCPKHLWLFNPSGSMGSQ